MCSEVQTRLPRECIQLLFWSSCCTDLFFLPINSNKCGAKFLGASPSSQLSCQNRALAPSPIVIVVESLKRRRSSLLQGSLEPAHGLESSVHSYQSQRIRRALPNFSGSSIPNPPMSFGLVTVGQLTRQCPPFAFSSPFQRKDLLILSIFFLAHATNGNTVR